MKEFFVEVPQQTFAMWVVQQIRGGFGLVPFVGSGLSAPSGILTGQNFTDYITWTVYRCVSGAESYPHECHDLQHEGWPEVPNQRQTAEAKEWVYRKFVEVCKNVGVLVETDSFHNVTGFTPASKDVDPLQSSLQRPLTPSVLRKARAAVDDKKVRALLRSLGREEELRRISPRHGQFATTVSYTVEAAIRSMYEWRATLDFLARLRVDRTGLDLPLRLAERADQAVVDGFNFRITRGKRPNFAHDMLCHLASRARIRTILTTNFDTLIEDSFAQLGERLEVIPVSMRGELPAPATVLAQGSLVKLHGALLETRADHSLDDAPSPEDLRRFFEYVMGRAPGEKLEAGHLPAILMVCGYSGSDMRCVEMIRHVLEVDRHATVLWVCHSHNDVRALSDLFKDYKKSPSADCADARVITTVSKRCDLLFYEIYQRLTLSLPRGGFNYQFSPNMPPGLDDPRKLDSSHAKLRLSTKQRKLTRELLKQLRESFKVSSHPKQRRILCAVGASGLLAPLRMTYWQVIDTDGLQGLWLWLGDHSNVTSLAHELLTAIGLWLGHFQLDHALLGGGLPPGIGEDAAYRYWKPQIDRLLEYWNANPDRWFIVVDGRNGSGGCADWVGNKSWKQCDYDELTGFLRALLDARNPQATDKGFHVLYAPFTEARRDHLTKRDLAAVVERETLKKQAEKMAADRERADPRYGKFFEHLAKVYEPIALRLAAQTTIASPDAHELNPTAVEPPVELEEPPKPSFGALLHSVCDQTLSQTAGGHLAAERRALYGAMLFRQSRHFSAFMSEGVYPCPLRYNLTQEDNDWIRYQHVQRWLKEKWREMPPQGIFHGKPGGFAWMYRDVRLGILQLCEARQPIEFEPLQQASVVGGMPMETSASWLQSAGEARARIHFWIGDWYARAYRSTGHAEPLLEAVHHYGQSVAHSPYLRPGIRFGEILDPKGKPDQGKIDGLKNRIDAYRRRYARRGLFEMIKLLRIGRREIRFWIQGPAGDPWFSVSELDGRSRMSRDFEEVFKVLPGMEEWEWEGWLRELDTELAGLPQSSETVRLTFRTAATIPQHDPKQRDKAIRPDDDLPVCLRKPADLYSPETWWSYGVQEWLKSEWAKRTIGNPLREKLSRDDPIRLRLDELLTTMTKHQASAGRDPEAAMLLNSGVKRVVAQAADDLRLQPQRLYFLAELIFEIAYATVHGAKRLENCSGEAGRLVRDPKALALWAEVCALCWIVMNLCVEFPPRMLAQDCSLRIASGTIYGLALGRLGRYLEAHRRLNEAHGWLSKSEARLNMVDAAIIEIRRGEVHLLEAMRIKAVLTALEPVAATKPTTFDFVGFFTAQGVAAETAKQWNSMYVNLHMKPGLPVNFLSVRQGLLQVHVSKLDDAWMALEPAQRMLAGRTHASLWWGNLYALQIRIYAEHWWPANPVDQIPGLYRARVFGERRDHASVIRKLYLSTQVAAREDPNREDPYRELSLLNDTARALLSTRRHLQQHQPTWKLKSLSGDPFVAELEKRLQAMGSTITSMLAPEETRILLQKYQLETIQVVQALKG